MKLKTVTNQILRTLSKRSPEIFIATGIGLMGLSVYLAVDATPKALTLIETKEKDEGRPFTTVEKVKTSAKVYIPSAIAFGTGAACIIGADCIHNHRNAALAVAASIAETSLKTYSDAVKKEIGEEKEKEIREAAIVKQEEAQKVQKAAEPTGGQSTVSSNSQAHDDVWCHDPLTDRYFWSTKDTINKAVNEFNRQLRYDTKLSCNEWYDHLGLDPVSIGDDLGWDIDRGYLEIAWGAKLDRNGTPAMEICYICPPRYIGI